MSVPVYLAIFPQNSVLLAQRIDDYDDGFNEPLAAHELDRPTNTFQTAQTGMLGLGQERLDVLGNRRDANAALGRSVLDRHITSLLRDRVWGAASGSMAPCADVRVQILQAADANGYVAQTAKRASMTGSVTLPGGDRPCVS